MIDAIKIKWLRSRQRLTKCDGTNFIIGSICVDECRKVQGMRVSDSQSKGSDLQPALGQLHTEGRPFLFNAWYIAAESSELKGGAIVGRTLLGKRIAVYRGQGGRPVAST